MISGAVTGKRTDKAEQVVDAHSLLELMSEVKQVRICAEVVSYIAQLIELTRNSEFLTLGARPRAAIATAHAAQATAYLTGRDYVTPDDVKKVFKSVTAHRVMISTRTRAEGHDAQWVIGRILRIVKVPVI